MKKIRFNKPPSNLILSLDEFNRNLEVIKNQPADFQSQMACALIQISYENLFNQLKKLKLAQ